MRPFEYASPSTKQQATAMLGADSVALAGGTDLLALMKDEVVSPKRVINLKTLPGMKGVTAGRGGLTIGALNTLGDLAENAEVAKHFPILHEALQEAASPQIRNMATLGGNVMQRPRCWYFRNGMGLLAKDDKGESLVLKGDNRYHAVLGNTGPAYFVSPSTIVPVLIAYGGSATVFTPAGKGRELKIEELFRIPQNENDREHTLAPNELVQEITLPTPAAGTHAGYYEVRQKEAFDWPLATAAVILQMSGNTVKSAGVVLGQVAPIPWISKEAADALVGKSITDETAMAAANAALAPAKALSMNRYKITVAKAAVKRAILNAARGGAR